jgi:hypothetical protein
MKVWIVEILFPEYLSRGRSPTVGIGLTRECARRTIKEWKTNNAGCKFRIRPYVKIA